MTWDVLERFLRWIFWGLVYLMVLVTALVMTVGMVPLPDPMKWAMFGVFVWGVVLDASRKGEPASARH